MKATWKNKHVLKVRDDQEPKEVPDLDSEKLRKEIEPWLTALFQSDHLSVMMGAGISSAVHNLATGKAGAGMGQMEISLFKEQIDKATKESAKNCGRGEPNIEDQIRVVNELVRGLEIYISSGVYGSKKLGKKLDKLKTELTAGLLKFADSVLLCEKNIISSAKNDEATKYLMSFLVSFASRSGTRERLNIFTTNYDRIVELGADLAGIRLIDRFVGSINPIFRSSRLEVDMHYNPPGIRGEPRYLEGVAHFSKLHGSLDWEYA